MEDLEVLEDLDGLGFLGALPEFLHAQGRQQRQEFRDGRRDPSPVDPSLNWLGRRQHSRTVVRVHPGPPPYARFGGAHKGLPHLNTD